MFHNLRDQNGRFISKNKEVPKISKKKIISKKNKVMHQGIVLDESGSMSSVRQSTQDGYNEYIQSMLNNNDGLDTYCTLVRFRDADDIRTPYSNQKLSTDHKIYDYSPNGMTPLYDSIGRIIKLIESNYNEGEAVTLTIFSDGKNNIQHHYAEADIRELIKDKRDNHNWMINFIGMGDIKEIQKMSNTIGIFAANTVSYNSNTDSNIKGIFATLDASNLNYRNAYAKTGKVENVGFFQD